VLNRTKKKKKKEMKKGKKKTKGVFGLTRARNQRRKNKHWGCEHIVKTVAQKKSKREERTVPGSDFSKNDKKEIPGEKKKATEGSPDQDP